MRSRRTIAAVLATLLGLALTPGVVAAHAELVTSDPPAGATLTTSPGQITGDFSQPVDPGRSSIELRGPNGVQLAVGTVPDGAAPTHLVIADVPALAPGLYEVRWTTITPDDNGVTRGTFTFTVAAAGASPGTTASAAGSPSAAASPAPAAAATPGAGDLLLPVLVLGAVLVGGAALFLRRRR